MRGLIRIDNKMSRIHGLNTPSLLRGSYTVAVIALILLTLISASCGSAAKPEAHEEEALSRTEFTDRIENFFEYTPLKVGQTSQFLIHLTDLSDGAPVENGEVTLKIRKQGGGDAAEVKAKVGRVTGIYVADVTLAASGSYDIEFHIKNAKLDERMPLKDFEVE